MALLFFAFLFFSYQCYITELNFHTIYYCIIRESNNNKLERITKKEEEKKWNSTKYSYQVHGERKCALSHFITTLIHCKTSLVFQTVQNKRNSNTLVSIIQHYIFIAHSFVYQTNTTQKIDKKKEKINK